MKMTRRDMLGGIAAGAALAAAPGWRARALTLGDWDIVTLSDGYLRLPAEFLFGPMPQEALAPLRAQFGLDADMLDSPCNVTLLRRGDEVVLFDCGAGPAFMPTAGTLPDALAGLGVDAGDVTHVIFTHGHPDHLWGVLDDFDEPVFYNAVHLMGRAERDYWLDPATVDRIGTERASFAVGARRRLDLIVDGLETFGDGDEILPGIAARASFGHTPGHMSFHLANGSDSVLVIGDAVGNGHLAFARPDWPSGSDQDVDLARASRLSLLDQAADERMTVIGFHLPGGGVGRVERADGAFRFVGLDQ